MISSQDRNPANNSNLTTIIGCSLALGVARLVSESAAYLLNLGYSINDGGICQPLNMETNSLNNANSRR